MAWRDKFFSDPVFPLLAALVLLSAGFSATGLVTLSLEPSVLQKPVLASYSLPRSGEIGVYENVVACWRAPNENALVKSRFKDNSGAWHELELDARGCGVMKVSRTSPGTYVWSISGDAHYFFVGDLEGRGCVKDESVLGANTRCSTIISGAVIFD